MVFAEATVMKTTEAAASVASNVATAMRSFRFRYSLQFRTSHFYLILFYLTIVKREKQQSIT